MISPSQLHNTLVEEDPGEGCAETWLFIVLFLQERMQGGCKRIRDRAELEMSGSGSLKVLRHAKQKRGGRYLLMARANLHAEKSLRTLVVCEIRKHCE